MGSFRIDPRGDGSRPIQVARVDRGARDRMATLVRQLAARRITNHEFDDRALRLVDSVEHDPAIFDAFMFCWEWYDDFRTHRLQRLSPQERRLFARVVLFLRSDEPYCWRDEREGRPLPWWLAPAADAIAHAVLGLWVPVFGLLRWTVRRWLATVPLLVPPRAPVEGERETAWPFADVASMLDARRRPTFLTGIRRAAA